MFDIDNLRVNFEAKVLEADRVILVPHKIADFDAIGSAIGLSLAVSKLKKASIILVDDKTYELDRGVHAIIKEAKKDFEIMNKSRYMAKRTDNNNSVNDLFVLTDVNKSYMMCVPELVENPENVMIIDHHETDDKTVESNFLFADSSISSASEVVAKLLLKMKVKIPSRIANYLLAGIYLDTNKLTKNVSSDTFLVASKLTEFGADTNFVMELFTEDYDSDRRVQELVNRTKMLVYKFAIVLADEGNEYTTKELARAADYGLNYGVDASVVIGKISDDMVAASARSKSSIDVGQLMKQIGGGGNPFSGAAKVENSSIEEVGKKLELVLRPGCYIEKKTEE